MNIPGWIGLDVDGTLTNERYSIAKEVGQYLKSLSHQGWRIVVLTGRTCTFGSIAVESFDFPFYFSAQNGSIIMEMPSKKIIFKNYMGKEDLPFIEEAFSEISGDFLIYSGFERGDFCYFRPNEHDEMSAKYIEHLKERQKEPWKELEIFDPEQIDTFPLAKGFGPKVWMETVRKALEKQNRFELALIRDPFVENFSILHITKKGCSKGKALRSLAQDAFVIAAGDDDNDLSMLRLADVAIVMESAPEHVLKVADIVAPPAKSLGIITALQKAFDR